MTKTCNRTQRWLSRYLRNELSQPQRASLEDHLGQCEACQRALAFQQGLDSRLDAAVEPPLTLRARIEAHLAQPEPSRSASARLFGDPRMKKILLSTSFATAALALGLVFVPNRAQAHTAHDAFLSMRASMARAFTSGELTITGSQKGDSASFSVLLDGEALPPDIPIEVVGETHDGYTEYTVTVDFSDANFKSITYGADHNTLKLVPEAAPTTYDVVKLDPKSGRPLSWSSYKAGSDKPVTTVTYKSKSVAAAPVISPSDASVTAHIRFYSK